MSYIRKRVASSGPTNRLASSSTNSIVKKKNLIKPVWDSTTNDLTQLKPTNVELERRKLACQSKNVDVVRYEKQKQTMLKSKKEQQKISDSKSQLALLKEILYDDEQLKKLILKSDMTLKTVQDFFAEDDEKNIPTNQQITNKKQAKINMTLAPNVTDLNESNLPYNPIKSKNETQQKNTISSAQIVNVNDLSDNNDNSESESEILDLRLKQAKKNEDFVRYRQLLEIKQELINKKLNSPTLTKLRDQQMKQNNEKNDLDECLKMLSGKDFAVSNKNSSKMVSNNDTEKINRLKDLIKNYTSSMNAESESGDVITNSNEDQLMQSLTNGKKSTMSNLNDDFRRALSDLENKMYEFEKEIGQKKASDCTMFKSLFDGTSSALSNSSYTLTLIKIISTLLDYQRETMKELNHEKLKNQESNKQLDIHRKLIDGLTNEILCVKEQNEKIGTVYINQANHQAKIEAEMDQIKIMLRSTSLFNHSKSSQLNPPHMDSQPKTSSAFYPAQQQTEHIIKPLPLPCLDETQQKQIQIRPMSCINSINDYNRVNNTRYPLDDALNEVKSDKFVERLNAMLNQNPDTQFNSVSCNNLLGNNRNLSTISQNKQNPEASTRSSSAFGLGNQFKFPNDLINNFSEVSNSDAFQMPHNNNQYEDLNAQIQELSAKNAKAKQKLRELQSDQFNSGSCFKTETDPKPKIEENLNKLKKEQQLLKDQISMLNKERESAQIELEVLSMSSSKINEKSNFVEALQNMEFNSVNINENITPNMSPIPSENHFQEGIETKSSANRFILESKTANSTTDVVLNKNRD